MIIKKATIKDYDVFLKLFCEVQEIHNTLYPDIFRKPSKKIMSRDLFEKYIENQKNYIYIAYDGIDPIGYIYAEIKPKVNSPLQLKPSTIYINQICVTHAFRKQGVAKNLISKVIELAKSRHIKSIQLDVWDLNEHAQISFKKLGFEIFNVKMKLKI